MSKTVLIIDDDHGIRMLLEETLLDQGYEVLTAETGIKGLDIIRKNPIDLLIMDYLLPIMNGIEVLEQLKKMNNFLPVILISGMVESLPEDHDNLLVKATISKPFNIVKLLDRVETILK